MLNKQLLQMSLLEESIKLYNEDSMTLYSFWEKPIVIISDGPYGVNGYPGDMVSTKDLVDWYEPHIKNWSEFSTPQTTLWFWNTEIGWATVHPILEKYGWEYKACNIWNKGMSHIAGNVNSKTLTKLPVVTEVCVQYVRRAEFRVKNTEMSMKDWLRYEWERTGLPLSKTNEACGVKNAASRKYFTKCHLWYMPPAEAFSQIAKYANEFGDPNGRPYFSDNGTEPISYDNWQKYRAKFYCPIGLTNVWTESQLNGSERQKNGNKAIHSNQKPLKIIESIISISTDENDVIWDPFGGLFTTAIACIKLKRKCYTSEIRTDMYLHGIKHVESFLK